MVLSFLFVRPFDAGIRVQRRPSPINSASADGNLLRGRMTARLDGLDPQHLIAATLKFIRNTLYLHSKAAVL